MEDETVAESAIRFTTDGESVLRDHLVWPFGRRASVAGSFHATNDAIGHLCNAIAEEIEVARHYDANPYGKRL